MEIKATAKINLGLDVVRKREDGYHDVRMIMQMTGMYDRISLTPRYGKPGIVFQTNLPYIPVNESNLAFKAAKILMDEFEVTDGLAINLQKFIPVAAGLAGGSTDAAAVLKAVNKIFRLGLNDNELRERGARLGADIPYCIMGGTALAEGIGERLTQLPDMPECSILLAKPPISVSTKEVYGALRADSIEKHPDIDGIIDAIREGSLRGVTERMANVLEDVTAPSRPIIGKLEQKMMDAGALSAIMSGSGPTVFGIFDDESAARKCRDELRKNYSAARVFLTRPCGNGGI